MATSPTFDGPVKTAVARIQNADAQTYVTVLAPGLSGSKLLAIVVASDDTAGRDITFAITKSSVDYPLGSMAVAANSGTAAATAGVNGLDPTKMPGLPIDRDGQRYLFLENGAVLRVKALTTVTAARAIYIVAIYRDF